MRKIDKSKILSKNYKDWLHNLGEEHPKYNSSNNKYYNDIKMSLLYCQKGLCAYSEELLCDLELIKKENWNEEKYSTLGLNRNGFKRRREIQRLLKAFEFELELEEPIEYITSWNMTLKQLKEDKVNA